MSLSVARQCYSLRCGYIVAEPLDRCPKCRGRMRTARAIRGLGWVQLFAGLFLIGFMGTLTYYIAPIMLRPEENSAGSSSFSGTLLQAQLVLGLFGLVIVFGVGSAVNGLWQVATGRRNRWITMIMLGLIGLFLIAEVVIRIVLDG